MAREKITLSKGDTIKMDITQSIIDQTMPCDKRSCLQSMAALTALTKRYGKRNYYVKSDSAGIRFSMDGRQYYGQFDRRGLKALFKFDRAFRLAEKNHSFDEAVIKARASITPYSSSFIITSSKKAAPPASPERKAQVNAARNAKAAADRAAGIPPKKYGPYETSRQLSL